MSREHSRVAAHIQYDLEAALGFALGPNPSTADRATAKAIIQSVRSFDDSQQCLIDVRERLGAHVFGHVALFSLRNQTSLWGPSEILTHPRMLEHAGLTLRDLKWPASEMKPMFAEHGVDTPGLLERLAEESASFRQEVSGSHPLLERRA